MALSPQHKQAIGLTISAINSAQKYSSLRKNHYGKGASFATAATYAGVGLSSEFLTHNIKNNWVAGGTTLALGIAGNKVISERVEKALAPKQVPKSYYWRHSNGKRIHVKNTKRRARTVRAR